MFTDWAEETCRELIADELIAADGATPDGLTGLSFSDGLRFWFDMSVVISVSRGTDIGQLLHFDDIGEEDRMSPGVDNLFDLAADIPRRALGDSERAVFGTFNGGESCELIDGSTALETETLKQIERSRLT